MPRHQLPVGVDQAILRGAELWRTARPAGSRVDIVAIHHHMTGTQPVVISLHYLGTGPAERLARGVRAALAVLGKRPAR